MNIRQSLFPSLSLLLLVCAGCRTPSQTPHTTRDPSVDFSNYRTFAVLPSATKSDLDPGTAKAVVAAAEKGARDALGNAGYTETNRESADLVFYIHGKVFAAIPVTDWGYQPALSTFGTSPAEIARTSYIRIFVEGYENRTKRQVWMDWVECTCTHVVASRIEGEIHHILEGFPSRVHSVTQSQ